jgi:hypothetical protein
LTSGGFSFSIVDTLSYPNRFTPPFFEEVMKWAYLKYLDLCLPKAMPEGRRTKSFALFDKAKPIERWGQKATDLSGFV